MPTSSGGIRTVNSGTHRPDVAALLKLEVDFSGGAAGWAAGIVYAVGSTGCGVPGVLTDFEQAFGTTMNTVRRRAAEVELPAGGSACCRQRP